MTFEKYRILNQSIVVYLPIVLNEALLTLLVIKPLAVKTIGIMIAKSTSRINIKNYCIDLRLPNLPLLGLGAGGASSLATSRVTGALLKRFLLLVSVIKKFK